MNSNDSCPSECSLLFPWQCNFSISKVSQSCQRGGVNFNGQVPTVTTSTRLWSFKEHRELLPEEMMAFHGLPNYNFGGCHMTQARNIVGNSMASTTLATVLVPVLQVLGRLIQRS